MALKKITPVHMAIQAIDDTIRELKLRRAELVATLPQEKKTSRKRKQYLVHPLTGEKREIKARR